MFQFLRDYGGMLLTAVVAPLIGVMAYRWRARIDAWKQGQDAVVRAEEAPMALMQKALAHRDAEVTQAREQLFTLVTNHLAHDSAERAGLVEVMTQCKDTMRAIQDEIVAHRAADRQHYEAIMTSLAEIKGAVRG